MTLRETEKDLISATLKGTDGNITVAVSMLGVDRSTVYPRDQAIRDLRSEAPSGATAAAAAEANPLQKLPL
jgi:DNA-binding NtrC family response regulator